METIWGKGNQRAQVTITTVNRRIWSEYRKEDLEKLVIDSSIRKKTRRMHQRVSRTKAAGASTAENRRSGLGIGTSYILCQNDGGGIPFAFLFDPQFAWEIYSSSTWTDIENRYGVTGRMWPFEMIGEGFGCLVLQNQWWIKVVVCFTHGRCCLSLSMLFWFYLKSWAHPNLDYCRCFK